MNLSRSLFSEKSVTTALFVAIIFVFGGLSVSRWTISARTVSAQEKRRLAACPHLRLNLSSMESFPAGFNAFYNDRFAFRNALLSTINLVQYKLFGFSSSEQVLVGHHDWLFFLDGGDKETLRGFPTLSASEREYFVKLFEARRAWLAQRKIRYLVFFPPSKSSVYREEVPAAFSNLNDRSRQDDLLAALRTHTPVEVVDVRPALTAAKEIAPLYYKTDTHWNRVGAFVAYLEVMKRLKIWFPSLKPLTDKDIKIFKYKFGDGDLATMMGLRDLIPENSFAANLEQPRFHYSNNPPLPNLADPEHHAEPFATEVDDPHLPRAVCLRDSFMQMPLLYFGENFRRIRYQWQYDFPTAVIEKERPDVVIQEITERFLARSGLITNPPELDKYVREDLFVVRPGRDQLAQTKHIQAN